ncbi:8-oxo-dGTP diphosphatase [Amycolatopsis sulphurea]|uniref:8-oxo-dGTP diphosphatase n=1 Tax=Amycolatopsis sulphurea TaxID=76022 RepID=A0A2A9F660_9PSEU|nr:NUDIX hydrolase [Amycolatopsis sulphurea]PFG46824.1 8-oxo-dGTP diphosphatase [Amycolatopsis sulphurea]
MSADVRAAGAVLWRPAKTGVEVALVHRPRYDDWSLPKGKVDPGETLAATAVREIAEETGFHTVLGRQLAQIGYEVPAKGNGKLLKKTVDYFSGKAISGAFRPGDEVDELRWLAPQEAERLLTRDTDVRVLREFCALPADLTTVLLVRHAKAGKRDDWTGDDDLRPLSEAGRRQADALRELLPHYGPDRVFSAPRLRCVRTVSGVAEDLGTEVRHEPLLSEEGYWPDPARGISRLLAITAAGGTPLVSSQGGVIPDLVSALADRDALDLPSTSGGVVPSKKGSLWVLSFRTTADGPVLVSADYHPSPLPLPAPSHT